MRPGEHKESKPFRPSPIYKRRLAPDEIRLLRLDRATTPSYPLHVNLEIHDQGQCPIYETVSYTWGGEDNDNSKSRPIFVGLYWDTLFQTKNCWDMVHFLRPWGGVKRLWVDAICINQGDDEERNAQVSKMASIYLGSRRVTVYLGKDLVHLTRPDEYPERHRLEDTVLPHADNGQAEEAGFYKLLGRRYFGRIWIIQELILPKQVVIPVEDGEWWADRLTGSSLPSWLLENSPVPWIENIAQGGLTGKDIYELVRATWSSKASDPRDRVFGVLALQKSSALQPDYSLSCLHVFMGLFAHSLITLKHLEVLSSASGLSTPDGFPSWIPDWKSSAFQSTRSVLSDKDASADLFRFWKRKNILAPPMRTTQAEEFTNDTKVIVQFTTEWKRAKNDGELDRDRRIRDIEWAQEVPSKHFVKMLTEQEIHMLKQRPWHRKATVDSDTGNLKINLTHLVVFSSNPIKVEKKDAISLFEVEAIGADASMYLASDVPLDQLIKPGKDHLFLLDDGSETSFIFLILRDAGKKGVLPMFKLIGCCYQLYFHAYAEIWFRESVGFLYDSDTDESRERVIIGATRRGDDKLFVHDLRNRKMSTRGEPWIKQSILKRQDKPLMDALLIAVQGQYPISATCLGLLNEQRGTVPAAFLKAYSSCIDERFHPVVSGDHIELTIQPEDWDEIGKSPSSPETFRFYNEMRYSTKEEWKSSRRLRFPFIRKGGRPIHLRASKVELMGAVEKTASFCAFKSLDETERAELEDVLLRWELGMGKEVLRPNWPYDIVEGFDMNGTMMTVCIM
ncbi:hypothetical protein CEP52_016641 [Fusarium oligoseptatum]|uniref:Heterokaryon incompatibility domain-containing protein n=1 Tax=Fusarium oligoseptatum TaxID=2604345 RepID=A0A428S1P4_9HYPO|nr:hypothetical protein CEP52_016641 [Fusarium oligoseptatum]